MDFIIPESNKWADFVWPEWVPPEWRKNVEEFWSEAWRRGPRAWAESNDYQKSPMTGTRARCWHSSGYGGIAEGTYLHTWNNMGVIVKDTGEAVVVHGVVDKRSIEHRRKTLKTRQQSLAKAALEASRAHVLAESELAEFERAVSP